MGKILLLSLTFLTAAWSAWVAKETLAPATIQAEADLAVQTLIRTATENWRKNR